MAQHIALTTLVVRDYDEAIEFYQTRLDFALVEDTPIPEQNKRWVRMAPQGPNATQLLLARAKNGQERSRIGNQTGGRVFMFLYTDDFWRDYNNYQARQVRFIREPVTMPYGTVAVFADLYGNQWDLLQPA